MEYELPNFKKFFPKNLIDIKNMVFRTWDNIEKFKNNADLLKIIMNVFNSLEISYGDLSSLIYDLKKTEKLLKEQNENYRLSDFLSLIEIRIEKTNISKSSLLEDCYYGFLFYYKDREVEKALKTLIDKYIYENEINSDKSKIYEEYREKNDLFFEYIYMKLHKEGIIKNNWKQTLIYYSINEEFEIFNEIINIVLLKNITNYIKMNSEAINNLLTNLLEHISIYNRRQCFKDILTYYKEIIDVDSYSKTLMDRILLELGHPDKKQENWIGFEKELIDIMKKWLIKSELENIFTIEVKDKRRLEFWKKYLKHLEKIKYYEELSQAIVMETKEHTFVEFGEKGNAFYAYENSFLNIHLIDELKRKSYSRVSFVSKLKNSEQAVGNITHSGSWEGRLMLKLHKLGYRLKDDKYEYNR